MSAQSDDYDGATITSGPGTAGAECCKGCSHQWSEHSAGGCYAWSPGSRVNLCPCLREVGCFENGGAAS